MHMRPEPVTLNLPVGLALLGLGAGLARPALAFDEYPPVAPRVMQVDVGGERTSIQGYYDNSWAKHDQSGAEHPFGFPVQGKFGLAEGLEASLADAYFAKDSSGHSGFDRPTLALKYLSSQGTGGFLAVTLPFDFGDLFSDQPYATFTVGAIYDRTFPYGKVYSHLSYSYNTEDVDKYKQDYIRLFVKPEYSVNLPALGSHYLGLNLGLRYDFLMTPKVNGDDVGHEGNLITVSPGAYFGLNKLFAVDASVPFTTGGQNQPATVGVRGDLYFNLDEGIYNSL